MPNPETKRSFGFLGRYAAEPELSSSTGVVREGAAGFPAYNHELHRLLPMAASAANFQ
jgi:hypothetical protein